MKKFLLLLLFPAVILAREWTTLVYMAADNGLAEWADSDLVEMEAIGSSDDIAIVAQVDKPNSGARRLFIRKGSSDELQDLGIIDMCDWQTLYAFLEWGIRNYPAEKYCVILWDHGTGWAMVPKRSFGSDWSSGNQLGIWNGDFQKAIRSAHDYTGERINLFAFDACLMQQIEIAFEIKDYAKIFLAPQNICPLQGFRYDSIFEELLENPAMNEIELAKRIVAITVENYVDVQPVVYSALNLENFNKLKENIDKVISSLMHGAPSQLIINMRQRVQTIPVVGQIPEPNDEHIDLGDFIRSLHEVIPESETAELLNAYSSSIVAFDYWGEDYSKTTGLTIWFPLHYLQFKQLLNYYLQLTWAQSQWLQFLNWFYDEDDIRPTPAVVTSGEVGGNNDFHLLWNASFDLAPVVYHVVEAERSALTFDDPCEDSTKWYFNGFSLSSNNMYSGSYSFFSGNASNLNNYIETKEALFVEELGLLSIYLYHNTEERADSLVIEYGPFTDVHYGRSYGWQERRIIVPAGNHRLKISYLTNSNDNKGGCYIDDIRVYSLIQGRYARPDYSDTTLYIYNKLRGNYEYVVYPEDNYRNRGNASNVIRVVIDNYAVPYSLPNPFQASCKIILDYPDSLNPTVEIFSLSGRRVKKFSADMIADKTINWDGSDDKSRDVGSGLYFILVKDGSFKRIGKIARQR